MSEIYIKIPFSLEKRLGKAYDDACSQVPNDDDWILILDHDVLLSLIPETIQNIYGYVERYPATDLFTCYSNRNHPAMKDQLLNGELSRDTNITTHINLAIKQQDQLFSVTRIEHLFAGFFMLFKKSLWNEIKFDIDRKCIGIDTTFAKEVQRKKKLVLRMDGVYVWHSYRLINGIHNTQHLR